MPPMRWFLLQNMATKQGIVQTAAPSRRQAIADIRSAGHYIGAPFGVIQIGRPRPLTLFLENRFRTIPRSTPASVESLGYTYLPECITSLRATVHKLASQLLERERRSC